MSTKEKILSVSKEHFASNGYEGTTLSMIAGEVGIRKPSLYSHYSSKADIFKDVLQLEFEMYLSSVKEILSNKNQSAVERMSALFKDHLPADEKKEMDNEFYYRFIKYPPVDIEAYTLDRYRETESALYEMFYSVVEEGKAEGEIDASLSSRQIYDTYFIMIDGIDTMKGLYSFEDAKISSENVWQVFYRGIKA
ncbi:TetR/AcrR family transcriptional regulator [Salinicoccus sp. YB14-2]|uniref:TetR/AcrR family transcriptional regulator n=1 Tax=Salinicoccus sp. YB14-2 TaxID=1572701 RepID=UPI00068D584B|nr:TetR/AcrR family transcriptional regulator [Salinicoccus sp. YB14-2]